MKTLAHSTAILVGLVAASNAFPAEHTKDSLKKVKSNVKDGKAVIVDVREQREWDAGHLKQAKLLPLSLIRKDPQSKEVTKTLPKKKIIYVHCKAGGRCLVAAELLKDGGYDLRPLEAGYADLIEAGFEKAKE